MPVSDECSTEALFDWLFAPLREWTRCLAAAQEIRNCDEECMRMMMEETAAHTGEEPARGLALVPMMHALDLDPAVVRATAPDLMVRLKHACAGCEKRSRCDRDLAAGVAAVTYKEFCANAERLDSLARDARTVA